LSQVWTNLIDNAADASPHEAGSTRNRHLESEPGFLARLHHAITVQAYRPTFLPHIFEPFFTTKPRGFRHRSRPRDCVHRIVSQKFAGQLEVQSQPGDTRFIIRLPVKTPSA
jgi:signal transduction histidine kinase